MHTLLPEAFCLSSAPCFDVRSPAEYAHAHIPGSHSLPLFSDAERAEIGTLYKKQGRQQAIDRGVQLVGSKLWPLLESVQAVGSKSIRLYCWRGGMRSGFVGAFLHSIGYEVTTLAGGYKAYRRFVLQRLERLPPLIVIGGFTGSGKTEFLQELQRQGEQVIDLEALACHRGSVFGGTDKKQPSNEQFENMLAMQLNAFDTNSPVWVEDESRLIGSCMIPAPFFTAMRQAERVLLEVPKEERIARIVRDYDGKPLEWWQRCVHQIAKRLGGARTKEVLHLLEGEHLPEAISLLLDYYDKAYAHSMSR